MAPKSAKAFWLPIAMFGLASFFYLYEFLLRVSPNVLGQDLMQSFGMNASALGLFSSCYYWSYAPLQLPIGALIDKYGTRCLLTLAVLICALSTLALAYTQNFIISCVTRFFIGAGSAFAFISCMKIINTWFHARHFAFMTGLTLTIGTLGAAFGGTPLSLALNVVSWRGLLLILGGLGVGLALLTWFIIQDKPRTTDTDTSPVPTLGFWQCLAAVMRQPQSWLVGCYAFFVTAPTDAFGGVWGVKFLIDAHGISRDAASTAAVTMTFIGMAVGSPILGWLAHHFDNRKIAMIIAALLAALSLTLIIYLPQLTDFSACLLFFCFGASGTYVLAFAMTRYFVQHQYVATAVGFINMLSTLGSALVTYLIGYFLDKSLILNEGYTISHYQKSLVILPLFYLLSVLLIIPFIQDKKI